MAIQGNFLDCGSRQKGTGLIDCIQELGKPNGFIDLGDWTANKYSGTLDIATINTLVLEGKWTPFTDSVDFADNTEDDVFQTFTSGDKRLVRDGRPEFDFIYTKGYHWHSAAYSHNTNQNGTLALIWENGVIGFVLNNDGVTLQGLKRGYLKTKPFQNNDGANVSQTMVSFQLASAMEYNSQMYLINEDSLGFSLSDIKGAIDTTFTVDPVIAAATTLSVAINPTANGAVDVLGVLPANIQITGQTVTAAVYNATTKKYDLTVDALTSGTKTISFGDGANLKGVDLSGVLYSGSNTFTIA